MGVNDSKLLKPRFREELAREIKKKALAWDVTEVRVSVINRIGIGKATEKAMRRTIGDLNKKLGVANFSSRPTPSAFFPPDCPESPHSLLADSDLGLEFKDDRVVRAMNCAIPKQNCSRKLY